MNHSVHDSSDCENSADDCAQLCQKMEERTTALFDIHHDWTQIVEEIHARQCALILQQQQNASCDGRSKNNEHNEKTRTATGFW
jgi:hypothetical protein